MFVRLLAGDFGDCSAGFGPGWNGKYRMAVAGQTYFMMRDVVEVELVTEENRARVGAMAAWAAAGAFLLGPIGALAGLLRGGHGERVSFLARFTDGKRALLVADRSVFVRFAQGAAAHQVSPKGMAAEVAQGEGLNAGDWSAIAIGTLATAAFLIGGLATLSLH